MAPEPALLARLATSGPVDVARLFQLAVMDPVTGYYQRTDAPTIGAAGDFVTAPEISQTFGELLGLALADAWARAGAPPLARLVELGPGRGTLMADLLRAVAKVPGFRDAACVHLVERSRTLRSTQAQTLAPLTPDWHDDVAAVPADGPLLLVANEFLDALPVHQLQRTATGWVERCVGVAAGGELAWTRQAAPPALEAAASVRFPDAKPGAVAEMAPARAALVGVIAERIRARGGLALLVDYGGLPKTPVDTLQAVLRHQPVEPLAHLGRADLSSAVDFAPLIDAAKAAGAAVFGPLPQARVLRALGIELRAIRLADGLDASARRGVLGGVRRLLDPRAMGDAFKVLALTATDDAPPAGFTVEDRR